MGKYMSEEEIISTLKRSSIPTTIIVEGKDDVKIHRWLEEDINKSTSQQVDILPCGCRSTLLNLYKLRFDFPNNVIFIADKDYYIYTTIPEEYSDVVFTTGYSIENDLYHGKDIEKLFNEDDAAIFGQSMNSYLEYYAREVEKCIEGENFQLKLSPQQILEKFKLKDEYKPEKSPQESTISNLRENYDLLLRGHSLFQLLNMVLTRKGRLSKPNMDSIYEICYKYNKPASIENLKKKIISLLKL